MKNEITKEEYAKFLSATFDDYKQKASIKDRKVTDQHIAELLYAGTDTIPKHSLISMMKSGKNVLPEKCIKNFCRIFRVNKNEYVDVYMAFKRWELKQKLKNL